MSSGRRQDQSGPPPRDRPRSGLTSLANRDQPVFTSTRRYHGLQQGAEFYTDSLNNSNESHIPSPSPTRPTYGGRPRQARGNNGRSLAATYNALGRNGHDTDANASSPPRSAGRRSAQRTRQLVSPQRISTRNSSNPSTNRNSREGSGTRTPSPSRRQQADYLVSPVSEASASSPAEGLAETYRRIQDEETLTSLEEEEGSEEDLETDDPGDLPVRPEVFGNHLRRSWGSPSPESRRTSRRASPQLQTNIACTGSNPDLHGSSRSSSPFDDDPDDDMSSQHERDQERVRSALSNNSLPFKRARKGLTVDSLRRHGDGSVSGSNSTESRSQSSKASDLSLNVPNGWGRKGKTTNSWLQRITENRADETSNKDDQPDDKTSESIENWMEEAVAVPLPHGDSDSLRTDESSPALSRLQPISRDASTTPSNTPPARIRNAAIDAIRLREIESLREQELTTNRLGALGEKSIVGRTGGRASRSVSGSIQGPGDRVSQSENTSNNRHVAIDFGSQASRLLKEPLIEDSQGNPISESPVVVRPVRGDNTNSVATQNDDASRRRGLSRSDSRQILRTLSRVESNSPSPQRQTLSDELANAEPEATKDTSAKDVAATPLQPHLKTPLVTGGWIETPLLPSGKGGRVTAQLVAETKALEDAALINAGAKSLAQETFLVTGSEQRPVRLEDTAPKLPGSALADILEGAKARRQGEAGSDNDDTFQLDDSTIESLEDLVANDEGSSNPKSAHTSKSKDLQSTDVTDKDREKEKDEQTKAPADAQKSDSILSKLTHLHSSIHQSKEDVSSLERQISSSSSRRRSSNPTSERPGEKEARPPRGGTAGSNGTCNEGGEMHDFFIPCEECARRARDNSKAEPKLIEWQTVRIPAPRLWVWHANSWPRLTRAGWWALGLGLLIILELIVADAYTPPFYATRMKGFGVDYRTPRPPFILAKLAWQHGLSYFLQPIWNGFCFLMRVFAALFGFSPGVFGHREYSDGNAEYVYYPAPEAYADMGFDADEYV